MYISPQIYPRTISKVYVILKAMTFNCVALWSNFVNSLSNFVLFDSCYFYVWWSIRIVDTALTIYCLFVFFFFPVTTEVEPCKYCEAERSHQGKWFPVLCVWIHERKSLSDDEKEVINIMVHYLIRTLLVWTKTGSGPKLLEGVV